MLAETRIMPRIPTLLRSLLLSCILALTPPVQAQQGARVADGSPEVEARMAAIMAAPEALGAAAAAGRKAAFFCVNCHGESGLSQHGHIPNLAGQHPVYLLTQIEKFADGRRQDEFMAGLIKVLKAEDRFNMAIYYASQAVSPTPAKDAFLAKRGQELYARACVGCHGAQGRGQKRIARLAGQQSEYLSRALNNYRSGKGRKDPVMTAVAKNLSSADISALAVYLPSMP
jgi:cbb3-type cytochrome c oxidase subunit III